MTGPMAPRYDSAFLAWNTVAGYDDHDSARAAVDRLAARGFPIEHLDIVGSDVKLVERVVGKMTRGRATLAGASQGVWMGLFVGLLMSLFAGGAAVAATIVSAVLVGAGVGAAFGLAAQSALKGKQNFATARSFVAGRYDVVARNGFAEQARQLLAQQDGPVKV
ncbi:YflT domain-containing protein [Jatrophihabitans fulvus]